MPILALRAAQAHTNKNKPYHIQFYTTILSAINCTYLIDSRGLFILSFHSFNWKCVDINSPNETVPVGSSTNFLGFETCLQGLNGITINGKATWLGIIGSPILQARYLVPDWLVPIFIEQGPQNQNSSVEKMEGKEEGLELDLVSTEMPAFIFRVFLSLYGNWKNPSLK